MYKRLISAQIKEKFYKGKAIIVVGARQTGKTTLSLELIADLGLKEKTKIFNCDNPTDRNLLSNRDLEFLIQLVGDAEAVFIDEGQKAEYIGQTLKLLVDYYKDKKQILVTGSSSFNLLDKTEEALTGRKFVFNLFPLSLEELFPDKDLLAIEKQWNNFLVFGQYPEIAASASFEEKKELLSGLASSYLYKDIFEFQKIKNPEVLNKLLKALALQIGNEVSYNELSGLVGVDRRTVENYIDILEKSFVIFRLPPYSGNKRKEISKLRKIYFYDLGIRNAVINNYNFLEDRNDVGALFENFVISEKIKFQNYHKIYEKNYFWRTYDGTEVDLVTEREGELRGYEIKWGESKKNASAPASWTEYSNFYKVITPLSILNIME